MDTKFTLIEGSGVLNFPSLLLTRLKSNALFHWPELKEFHLYPEYQLMRLSERGKLLPFGMRDVPKLKGRSGRNGLTVFEDGWEVISGIPRDQEVQKALGLMLMNFNDNVVIQQDITEVDLDYTVDSEPMIVTYTKASRQELYDIVICELLDNPETSSKLDTIQTVTFERKLSWNR